MRLFDAHCHLESAEFKGILDAIIGEARQAGIVGLMTCACAPDEWDYSRSIAARFAEVEFALGVHPWLAKDSDLDAIAGLYEARDLGARAIGEIGLDRKIDSPSFEFQVRVFEEQLAIAKEIGLPVIVHCRGAFEDLIRSLRRVGSPEPGALGHAFSGSVEIAEQLIPFGFSFSMGRSLTYRNSAKLSKVLKRIYPDHFLLETDSPAMPPVEARDAEYNVPANIRYCLRAAAETLGLPEEDVAATTTRNALRLFGLNQG